MPDAARSMDDNGRLCRGVGNEYFPPCFVRFFNVKIVSPNESYRRLNRMAAAKTSRPRFVLELLLPLAADLVAEPRTPLRLINPIFESAGCSSIGERKSPVGFLRTSRVWRT